MNSPTPAAQHTRHKDELLKRFPMDMSGSRKDELDRAYAMRDAACEEVDKLRGICRENIISARIIAAENAQGERNYGIARDAKFIIDRTETALSSEDFQLGCDNAVRDARLYGLPRVQERAQMFRQRIDSGGNDPYQLGYIAGVERSALAKARA